MAVDETILKYNGRKCYLFAALDVERNKIVHLKVYPARNALTAYSFLKEVLKICEVEELILEKGVWLNPSSAPSRELRFSSARLL
ncbi:MAG: DDE-type integrase/transposase/recombinase [Candidatus Syntropharchaeia archaeon]